MEALTFGLMECGAAVKENGGKVIGVVPPDWKRREG